MTFFMRAMRYVLSINSREYRFLASKVLFYFGIPSKPMRLLYPTLAISLSTFADMTTYYCITIEEALRRVKRAVKVAYPGCYFGGVTLRSGRRGFAVYREGKVIEQYTFIGR